LLHFQIMARNRKRKTDREIASAEQMKVAVLEVIEKGASKKGVAERYGIKRTTLRRYIAIQVIHRKYKVFSNVRAEVQREANFHKGTRGDVG